MKNFINSHLPELFMGLAWTFALALAIGIRWLIVLNANGLLVNYWTLMNLIIIAVTFLTVGIRLFPCFRNGVFGSCCKNRNTTIHDTDDEANPTTTDPVHDATRTKKEGQDGDNEQGDADVENSKQGNKEEEIKVQENKQELKEPAKRVYFLDSVKIFLTAVVVSHHVICQFTASGVFGIKIGNYDNWFRSIFTCILGLDQGYFMALFFFISAYFNPTSYDRKGEDVFLFERAKRLFIPAIFVTTTVMPLTGVLGQATAGFESLSYGIDCGPTWFIYWLLLLNFVYHSFRAVGNKQPNGTEPAGFPVFWKRSIAGAVVCGLLMWVFLLAISGTDNSNPTTAGGDFYTMPTAIGSFSCYVFFFGVGTIAAHNEWLSTPIIPNRLSRNLLFIGCLVEFAVFAIFGGALFPDLQIFALSWIFIGMYCVDMSTFMLSFFQTYFNTKPGSFGRFLSKSAYTVYLVHPIVITGFTSAFIRIYNLLYGDVIQFDDGSTESSSHLLGPGDGALSLFVGCLIVNVLSQLVVWPLAYAIRSLPGLNKLL